MAIGTNYPGNDGKTRVVTLKTENSVLKRAITKIVPIPGNEKTVQVANEKKYVTN